MFIRNLGRLVALLMTNAAFAAASPDTVTLFSGKYEINVSPKYKWTVRGISYSGIKMGLPSGYYGTVMAAKSGKYIGSGHSEGGTEQIKNLTIEVDGQKIAPQPGVSLTGKKIVIYKESMFDKLLFQTRLELTADGLSEQKRFKALADQPVSVMYLTLLCWSRKTTDWLAEKQDGKVVAGTFGTDYKGKSRWHLMKDINWAAIYDRNQNCGMLIAHPSRLKSKNIKYCFWEVRNIYNKYYFQFDTPKIITKGYTSPISFLILQGFNASQEEWRSNAEQSAVPLMKLKPAKFPDFK